MSIKIINPNEINILLYVHVIFEKNYTVRDELLVSQDSLVGVATVYALEDREVGVRVPVESRIFSSPRRPDRL
jgi:hypothetical protein